MTDAAAGATAGSAADGHRISTLAFESLWRGSPAARDELLRRASFTPERLDRAIGDLLAHGRLELDAGGAVVGAHGLTLRETVHRLTHADGSISTWCAYDAIGIPAARQIDAHVTTVCPTCGRKLEVVVTAGEPDEVPFRLWMPTGKCTNLIREFCRAANLFCSGEHLERWRVATGSPTGEMMTPVAAARSGRAVWSDVACPAPAGPAHDQEQGRA